MSPPSIPTKGMKWFLAELLQARHSGKLRSFVLPLHSSGFTRAGKNTAVTEHVHIKGHPYDDIKIQ
jgi:hypothetical protein